MNPKQQEYIELNQQFDRCLFYSSLHFQSSPSPIQGVQRVLLERRGDQVARRATSIVTYIPNSSFARHTHRFGEQFYVLQGCFSDQTGDFTKGYYVRNPVGSSHAPFSKEGAKIFVKLGQMAINQKQYLRKNTLEQKFTQIEKGIEQLNLFQSEKEYVSIYRLEKSAIFRSEGCKDISQILVIEGLVSISNSSFPKQSWVRIPSDQPYEVVALEQARIYLKIGKGVVRDKDWNEIEF